MGGRLPRVAAWHRSGVSAPTRDGRGPVFPRRDDPQRSAPPELLSEWILKAEAKVGLPKLEGGTCHPFRRKWKSEWSHHPVKAVAVAGGWTDIATMLRCYDHPDDATYSP
jgi:integrase